MQIVNQLKIKATPVFYANKKAYEDGFPVICNEGGSRSSKSYSVVQLLIHIAISNPNTRISMVSHSLPHIKRGVYRDFKGIMEQWNIWDEKDFRYTDFIYTFKNGSYIELFGLEDPDKAKGPARDILFVNEANLISKALFDQLLIRTTGQVFLDWNPADFISWVYEVADNPKNKRIHSTYLNNISNLSDSQIRNIEQYKDLPDDFMWKVYGLGERGSAKEIIYTQWKQYDEAPDGDVFYGLDFGYVHPAALIKVTHHEGQNYFEEIVYQSGLTLSDLSRLIKEKLPERATIYADAAEPKSIEELYRQGFNIKPAQKDVWAGIVKMKSYPINLHYNSKNLRREFMSYKWKKDKNDNVIEEPVKANDDLMDACRYAIFTHLTKLKFEVSVF
ncbi:XtmB Phage terminase large subunit [uncultured Caudovirales phage]|uniref:XtmB Phage terminase large subunit n=1 Tax=uncultured Caudovirales phage TaxID=2100421 RepID=A0A6J5M449_9CAUD|nr:XtmB Phage terminase large subunit [uncultured Caudovirales phage]